MYYKLTISLLFLFFVLLHFQCKQKENSSTTFIPKDKRFLEIIKEKPTYRWRKSLNPGGKVKVGNTMYYVPADPYFTLENIAETDGILNSFIDQLVGLDGKTQKKDVQKVYINCILKLNKLGGIKGKYQNLIETTEREELADFIIKSVKLTGYKIKKNEDITLDYREW